MDRVPFIDRGQDLQDKSNSRANAVSKGGEKIRVHGNDWLEDAGCCKAAQKATKGAISGKEDTEEWLSRYIKRTSNIVCTDDSRSTGLFISVFLLEPYSSFDLFI